jgi:ligand-binding SRPBCC domain-containing protein
VKTYHLEFEQNLPLPLADAWDFFSSPLNLARITPKEMKFTVTSNYTADTKMYPGMIITYHVSPVFGIKMNWMTEITHVKEHEYFVDNQVFGPYALWHHQHHFKEIPGGVKMTDILDYAVPYSVFGRIANAVLVKKEVQKIFMHRTKSVDDLFGKYKEPK